MFRSLTWVTLALLFTVVGYFLFAIVVAIYAGLWLHDEKLYYAQEPWCHLFGAVGAGLGVLLARAAWRLATGHRGEPVPPTPAGPTAAPDRRGT